MHIIENPAKVRPIVAIILVVTLVVLAINTFALLGRGEAGKNTNINSVIAKIGVIVILSTFAFVVIVGVMNKMYRNKLKSQTPHPVQRSTNASIETSKSETPVVVGGTNDSAPPDSRTTDN